jgi:protein-S-isoprenylcysteine O-methyltransferase Ste14
VRATDFEFKYRFFVLCAIFGAGFLAYQIDPQNLSAALARLVVQGMGAWGSIAGLTGVFLWIGSVIVLCGAGLRTWASAYLGADVVGDSKLRSEALVANGPYRYVRNPLYLGLILLAAGMSFAASLIGCVILVAGTTLFLLRLALREESELLAKQGPAYEEFFRRVPRLVPTLSPRLPAGGSRPRWGQAFLGEIMMWGFVAGMTALAATRDATLFQKAIVASLVAFVIARVAQTRKQ